jgi:hypothetical protein
MMKNPIEEWLDELYRLLQTDAAAHQALAHSMVLNASQSSNAEFRGGMTAGIRNSLDRLRSWTFSLSDRGPNVKLAGWVSTTGAGFWRADRGDPTKVEGNEYTTWEPVYSIARPASVIQREATF